MHKKSFVLGYALGLALTLTVAGLLVWRLVFTQHPPALGNLDLVDLDGRPVSAAQLAGRPVVVDYWATWCAPCVREFPVLAQAKQQVAADVQFVLISDEPAAKLQAFARQHPYPFTFWRARKPLSAISARPSTYLFDRHGRLVDQRIGSFADVADVCRMLARIQD